jgi:uncharacterized small protein (DUF1192 family)
MNNTHVTEIRKRIHGPCSIRLPTMDDIDFDVGLFFRRLLLFDTYFMHTIRLMEFPHLVRLIGYEGVIDILNSGLLKLDCDTTVLAEISRLKASKSKKRKGSIKLGSFSFANVMSAQKKQYVSSCLECISSIPGITFKQKKKLKRAIVDQILPFPENSGQQSITNFRQDVTSNRPVVKSAIIHQIKKQKNLTVNNTELQAHFTQGIEEEDEFDSETNISSLIGLSEDETHKILQSALFGVGTLNRRIENMQCYNALSGFIDDEVPLFEEKLSFLEKLVSPNTPVKEFQRVISITGLPDFDHIKNGSSKINIEKFLKVRDSEECRNFREWIASLESTTDEEIKERTLSLRTKIASAIHSPMGGAIRFLATTAFGFAGASEAVNIGVDALDNFLLDKILPKGGVATFIHKMYPSIFEKSTA